MTIFVTGGSGFFSRSFILDELGQSGDPVVNIDKLICAGISQERSLIASASRQLNHERY